MTYRLCLVGNSHLAALKRALTSDQESFKDLSIAMFGASGTSFGDLAVEDGAIVARSDAAASALRRTGGSNRVVLSDYDGLVVIGGGAKIFGQVNLLKLVRPPFANPALVPEERRDALATLLEPFSHLDEPALVSSSLFAELMRASVMRSNAARLLSDIARGSSLKLGYVPTPFPSSGMRAMRPNHLVSRLVERGMGAEFAALTWDALMAALPPRTTIVRPPGEVLVEGIMTDEVYTKGSVGLDRGPGEHEDDDLFHMNDAYGAIMLKRVVKAFVG